MKSRIILFAFLLSSSLAFSKVDPPCVFSLIDFGPVTGGGIWIIPDDPGCGGGVQLLSFLQSLGIIP